MIIQLLFSNPPLFFMIAVSLLFSLSIHEYAHAQAAYFLGDPTAKNLGRLTVNPLAHLDPFGTLFLFFIGIGWGKPVPVNPLNFKDRKWGSLWVGLAGPASNFFMALVLGLSLRFFEFSNVSLVTFFVIFVWLNIILGVFNLLPVPPLDGSHVLMALLPSSMRNARLFLARGGFMLVILAIIFMMYVGFPFICRPLFSLITGMAAPL